jgi:hypothetical protein
MRRFDKTKNMTKVNLLAEQRYLTSKGLINEEETSNDITNKKDLAKNGYALIKPNNE